MNWLFFALLAPLIYAIVVYIDKYILEKYISDYRGMPIYGAIVAAFLGCLLWVITGFPLLTPNDTLLILFTGMLTIWGAAFYFQALSDHEASNITILFQTMPIMALILSFIFLGERISNTQLVGFFVILTAIVGVSLEKGGTKFRISPAFVLILLSNLFWAVSVVLFKFITESNAFSKLISYESWGLALGGLIIYILFPSFRTAFKKTQKEVRELTLAIIFFNESTFLVGKLFFLLAISMGSVPLVSVIGGTQVFFAILFGYVLTFIAPKIFKENISREGLFKKAALGSLVVLGLWLVNS